MHVACAEAPSTYSKHPDAKLRAATAHKLVTNAAKSAAAQSQALEIAEDACENPRHEKIEESATQVLIAIWKAIQRGAIDERSAIADAALTLRDSLNPAWPNNPNWLPEELQD